jgi:tetratricopeptide (TPR) repeat protein
MTKRFISAYLLTGLILSLSFFDSCQSKTNKEPAKDGSFIVRAADTVTDVKTIVARVNTMVTANRLDDAADYITVNLHRFSGSDKAILLNERGGAYFLKDDLEHAVADYLAATEIDSENNTYLINVAKTYESMQSLNNASFFAKKILDLKTVSDSDKAIAHYLIQRCDRVHAGH